MFVERGLFIPKNIIIMGTNRFRIRVHLLSFILLLGLFMYSSCVKEHMEQAHQKEALDVMASRGISISASLSCFFNHSISLLDTVIMNLSNINENQEFIGEFLKEYGIPLWNCTYIIDDGIEQTYFVPLYNGQTSLEITSLWFFHVSEGKIIYAPFRRDDPSIAGHEQCFVFDLLSYLVFGEENSSGLIFGEKIGFQFVVSDGSGYVHSNRTLNLDVDQINSNALLHEMMHLYQTLTETEFSYESSLMNRELEARYAQYVYLQNKSYLARAPYECSEWNIMASINDYIDDKGHLREGSDNDSFAAFLEYQIIPIYHSTDTYKNYTYDLSQSGTSSFSNIQVLTQNCD